MSIWDRYDTYRADMKAQNPSTDLRNQHFKVKIHNDHSFFFTSTKEFIKVSTMIKSMVLSSINNVV